MIRNSHSSCYNYIIYYYLRTQICTRNLFYRKMISTVELFPGSNLEDDRKGRKVHDIDNDDKNDKMTDQVYETLQEASVTLLQDK